MFSLTTSTANKVLIGIIVISGLSLLAGTIYTYNNIPPIPDQVITEDGHQLFDRDRVKEGQAVFQKNNLMSYGTLLGNGSYYGPDYTAEVLDWVKQEAKATRQAAAEGEPSTSPEVLQEMVQPSSYSDTEATVHPFWRGAYKRIQQHLSTRFVDGAPEEGIPANTLNQKDIEPLAAFFTWTALFSSAERGDSGHTFTNNFPPMPELGMTPTGSTIYWTAWTVAIVLLVSLLFIMFYTFVTFEDPPELPQLERAKGKKLAFLQKVTLVLLAGCALVYLLQTIAGGYLANAYVSRDSFYGIFAFFGLERMKVLPFRAVRSAHTSMAVIWIVGMWMSGSLYVSFQLGGKEQDWHRPVTYAAMGILVLSVIGTLTGVYLSTLGVTGEYWALYGTEGTEYLEMGRLWRYGIAAGFVAWTVVLTSVLWNADVRWQSFLNLLMINGLGITTAFFASFMYSPDSHWVIIDFWRWWVVHHWVEGIFAFFQLLVLGWFFAGLKLVTRQEVTKSLYLEGALILMAGFLAVGHHFWWVGEPSVWIGVGSVFSTLEVVPLFMLVVSALNSIMKQSKEQLATIHRLPLYFFIASAFWQFLGSAVLGLLINFPIINYFEHGTFLTVAHAHAAFLGAFGFLALGLLVYCFRHAFPDDFRPQKLWWGFWLMNVGLFIMVFISVTPIGVIQLVEVVKNGYASGRSVGFYEGEWVMFFNELRMPGDTMIIIGAAIYAYVFLKKVIVSGLLTGRSGK